MTFTQRAEKPLEDSELTIPVGRKLRGQLEGYPGLNDRYAKMPPILQNGTLIENWNLKGKIKLK